MTGAPIGTTSSPVGSSDWERVAAPGTDPQRLLRTVAALVRPGVSPLVLGRRAVELAVERGAVRFGQLLDDVAPTVTATDREAVAHIARTWAGLGVRVALVGDTAYPDRLASGWPWNAAPITLAWRGPEDGLPLEPAAAIVGARRASGYGRGIAAWLAEALGHAGVLTVSGGAVGVDAAAHAAAIGTRGRTAVVLGCGHDVTYPSAHATPGGLFDRILEDGGWLCSEYLPGTPPTPPHVLARNRIVAGLADAVVVVEGGARSGALRTAASAADLGVPVLAVPGDVRRPGSVAPHRLLAEGATPCTGPDDLLAVLGHEVATVDTQSPGDGGGVAPGPREARRPSVLPPEVHRMLAEAWPRPIDHETLATGSGIAAGRLLAAVTRARVAGELVDGPGGLRLSRSP